MKPCRALSVKQQGQALVLGLFLMALAALAWVQLHQGGQFVHEKTRLVHASDAAAYSGALVQARALNYLALANRAQVAHQIALAHLVTLQSLAVMGVHAGQRVVAANPPAYLITAFFGPEHGAAYASSAASVSAVQVWQALQSAIQEHDRVVHDVLGQAQQQVLRTLPHVRQLAMQSVLQANFTGSEAAREVVLDPQMLTDDLPGSLLPQIGGAAPLRDWVLQAVAEHPFLAPRHAETRNAWVVSSRCPHLRHVLRRRGETQFQPNDSWWAGDTLSYHALRSNRWVGCYHREYPMGWADVAAAADGSPTPLEHVMDPPRDFSQQDYWRWVQSRTGWNLHSGSGNPLANSWAVADQQRQATRGLGPLVTLSRHEAGALRLAIRVSRPLSSLALTGGAGQVRIAERWWAPWRLPSQQIAAIAAAEVYFVPMMDREMPSLFTPAWRARLMPPSDVERTRARARQGAA